MIAESLNVINVAAPLDKCDVDILRNHIEEQLFYVNMINETSKLEVSPWKILT
jgi:hypothetical protein